MKAFLHRVLATVYFYLCFAPVPMLLGQWLVDDFGPALIAAGILMPLSLIIVLLPDRLGGHKRKPQAAPIRRGGGDPDPDRNLRSEALPEEKRASGFPLRVLVLAVCAAVILAAVCFAPILGLEGKFILYRALLGASLSVMLLMAAFHVATDDIVAPRAILTGVVAHLAVGFLSSRLMHAPRLSAWLYWLGVGFLLITAFLLNEQSLSAGAISSQAYKAPRSIRWRNRVILIVFALIVLAVGQFDTLRRLASDAVKAVTRAVFYAIDWFNRLLTPIRDFTFHQESVGDSGSMFLGEAEASPFWEKMEVVAYVLAAVIALCLLGVLGVKLAKALKKAQTALRAWMRNFARGVGEDYQDVRESLLDFGEERQSLGESLRRRVARIFQRDPKWSELDPQAKVRFLLTLIYRKNRHRVSNISSLTAREALAEMNTGFQDPAAFADLYDRARYSQNPVTDKEADAAKREAKV